MIGFKITKGDTSILAGVERGSVMFLAHRIKTEENDKLEMYLSGLKSKENQTVTWISPENLKVGDKITIEVLEMETPDAPLKIEKRDEEKLVNQSKLKYFYKIKKELEEKGLL